MIRFKKYIHINWQLYDDNGQKTGQKVALSNPGVPLVKDGKPVILDENGNEVASHDFKLAGQSMPVYSDATEQISFSSCNYFAF